jgi:hypothetical protein
VRWFRVAYVRSRAGRRRWAFDRPTTAVGGLANGAGRATFVGVSTVAEIEAAFEKLSPHEQEQFAECKRGKKGSCFTFYLDLS